MVPHSSTLAWKIPWTEKPGRLQSMGSLESDTTGRLHIHFSLSCIGEGNGNPLQCSSLESPRDRGAWWAAVSGVAQSQTQLKRLSSSSSLSLLNWQAGSLLLAPPGQPLKLIIRCNFCRIANLYSQWTSPGQDTGVGSLSVLQHIFQTQELHRGLLHCRWILYRLNYQGNPFVEFRYLHFIRSTRARKIGCQLYIVKAK